MLKEKIENKTARFGVVGLGYVGLPLAVEFAKVGLKVTGFEVDPGKVEELTAGRSYIGDVPTEELAPLVEQGLFNATTDFDELAEMDVISICVPTPLSKTRDPDMTYVVRATQDVARRLRKGQLVILESTTYPGTTDELVCPELEASGLTVGEDFYLAFSPERVDPSNPTYGIKNTPKVVGGVDEPSGELARTFYALAIDDVHKVSSAAAAELSKLLENTFRSVNIGLVNEVAMMCHRLGIDCWEVIDAAATKPFGFMKFVPGPGLGGHCIPVDPSYLSWKMKSLNFSARFIELATEINSRMPEHVVDRVTELLNEDRLAVNGAAILVMGVAYKKDVGDMRESPAIDVIGMLARKGGQVRYHDPFVPECEIDGVRYKCSDLTDELVTGSDIVVILTDHSRIDYADLVEKARHVFDTRNATHAIRGHGGKITKL